MKKTLLLLATLFAFVANAAVPSGVTITPADGSEFEPGEFPTQIKMVYADAGWLMKGPNASNVAVLTGPDGFESVPNSFAGSTPPSNYITFGFPDASSITTPGTYTFTIDATQLADFGDALPFTEVQVTYIIKGEAQGGGNEASIPEGVTLTPPSGSEFEPGGFPSTIKWADANNLIYGGYGFQAGMTQVATLTGPEGFDPVNLTATVDYMKGIISLNLLGAAKITTPGEYTLTIDTSHFLNDDMETLPYDKVVALYTIKGEAQGGEDVEPAVPTFTKTYGELNEAGDVLTLGPGGWTTITFSCETPTADIYVGKVNGDATVEPDYQILPNNQLKVYEVADAGVFKYYAQNGSLKSEIKTLTVEFEKLAVPTCQINGQAFTGDSYEFNEGEEVIVTLAQDQTYYIMYTWTPAETDVPEDQARIEATSEPVTYDAPLTINASGTLAYYNLASNGQESDITSIEFTMIKEEGPEQGTVILTPAPGKYSEWPKDANNNPQNITVTVVGATYIGSSMGTTKNPLLVITAPDLEQQEYRTGGNGGGQGAPVDNITVPNTGSFFTLDGYYYVRVQFNPSQVYFGWKEDGGAILPSPNLIPEQVFVYQIDHNVGVGTIGEEEAAIEYFDLNGRNVKGDLLPGIYVKRQGEKVFKVIVK